MCDDDFCEEVPPKKPYVSSWFEETVADTQITVNLTEEEEVEMACLDSNISKVSNQCKKMVEDLQRIHIKEPLRVILGDLIEAVTITNKVQEGLSSKVRSKLCNSKSYNETYGKIAAAPPTPSPGYPRR